MHSFSAKGHETKKDISMLFPYSVSLEKLVIFQLTFRKYHIAGSADGNPGYICFEELRAMNLPEPPGVQYTVFIPQAAAFKFTRHSGSGIDIS